MRRGFSFGTALLPSSARSPLSRRPSLERRKPVFEPGARLRPRFLVDVLASSPEPATVVEEAEAAVTRRSGFFLAAAEAVGLIATANARAIVMLTNTTRVRAR